MVRKLTVIIFIFVLLTGTSVYAGADALSDLKAVNVNVTVYDKVGRGLNKTTVKNNLLKHIKNELTEKFKKGRGIRLSNSATTTLQIKITIDGDKQKKEYNITTEAVLKRAESEWRKQVTDHWDKKKNIGPIKKAENAVMLIKRELKDDQLSYQEIMVVDSIREYFKDEVEDGKIVLARAEKQLTEAKKRVKITYTIKQTLTNIASGFFNDYMRAN